MKPRFNAPFSPRLSVPVKAHGSWQRLLQQAQRLQGLGQLAAAQDLYRQVLASQAQQFDALFELGRIALQSGQFVEAEKYLSAACVVKPDHALAHNDLGVALAQQGRDAQAIEAYAKAVALDPKYAQALNSWGSALAKLQRHEEALAYFDRAIAARADYALAHNNRGNALLALGQDAEAKNCFDRAIQFNDRFAQAYHNRGALFYDRLELDAALADYERALSIKPDLLDSQWDWALIHLSRGDFLRGWPAYEVRWIRRSRTHALRPFKQPRWLGESDLTGKTILLHHEQGLGDTLQFCRYAGILSGLGAKVILEVQPALVGVLTQLAGVHRVTGPDHDLEFDLHCPLMSLPLALKTDLQSIPPHAPALAADQAKVAAWRACLPEGSQPRIGLVWSGNPAHANDRRRSLPLARLLEALPPGPQYISLQKDVRPADAEVLGCHPHIAHFGDRLQDFSDTAALCELVDLVVSVDTSVAHLAGAMGKPVWVLLTYKPDWRWLLSREDSPWYPSARLFRQARLDDWSEALRRLGNELRQYVLAA